MGEPTLTAEAIAERALGGHVPSLARLIRWLEDDDARGHEAARILHPRGGRAHVVGVTGPPGAGKSTLVSGLVAEWRARGKHVAVLAVDPTSPFSGGAILGDRVRMHRHTLDPGCYIRSMATRGALGGLARPVFDTVSVLDAVGFEVVIVETVGVGQDELDIVRVAHTTAVVCIPGTGDDVQALKAGVLEIADCFVLNKADLPGADATERVLREMLHLESGEGWQRPLLRTVAERDEGLPELVDTLVAHRAHLVESGELAERESGRAWHAVLERLRRRATDEALRTVEENPHARGLIERVTARKLDAQSAADALWRTLRDA